MYLVILFRCKQSSLLKGGFKGMASAQIPLWAAALFRFKGCTPSNNTLAQMKIHSFKLGGSLSNSIDIAASGAVERLRWLG